MKMIFFLKQRQTIKGGGRGGLRYCGTKLFFLKRHFGNFDFKVWYCGII